MTEKEDKTAAEHKNLLEQLRDAQTQGRLRQHTRRTAICANCHVGSEQVLESQLTAWPTYTGSVARTQTRLVFQFWECHYCGKSTVLAIHFVPEGETLARKDWQVWPENPPRQLSEEAPDEARSLYREASLAENAGALRGAAALYRAVVEEVCRERGAKGKNLEDRIDDLKRLGADDDLILDLHEARMTGNWSLHDGLAFSAAEVADLAYWISQAVQQMYVEPAKREAMREARKVRREERKRESE